jgi:acyl-CoA thioester hydrolase
MELRVRFAETDAMGIAHHAAYVVYLEAARIEWLRTLGLSYRDLEASGVSFAVTEVSLTYRTPARFDDLLRIDVTLTERRSRGLRFGYRLHALASPEPRLIAHGTTLHVATDRAGRAIRLPEAWATRLDAATAGGAC